MHAMDKRIYYHDTDCGGVVYYANYLKYFEEARTEYMRDKGLDLRELAKKGVLFVVRRVEIDYKAPARYGDELLVLTDEPLARSVSLNFSQQIKRSEELLVSAKTQLVCVDMRFKPAVIPEDLVQRF
jgi:acyl-CoA thioester hydrolase